MLCQVRELGLCATGFASAGRQNTTFTYTGPASGTPNLSLGWRNAFAGMAQSLRLDDATFFNGVLASAIDIKWGCEQLLQDQKTQR